MVTIMSFANGLCSFLGSPKGLPYRLVYTHEKLIVFCGTPRTSSPTGNHFLDFLFFVRTK